MLSFNSVLPSLGVYTTPAYYRMIFDGFLTLKSCTYICTYVCVSPCVGASLHIQEIHVIGYDWGVRYSRPLAIQHKQSSRAER